jgi:hypothetical protein
MYVFITTIFCIKSMEQMYQQMQPTPSTTGLIECAVYENEDVFQNVLEKHLRTKHKNLKRDGTDLTYLADDLHCEIKHWQHWKAGVEKLLCDNQADPKAELRIYCFGMLSDILKHESTTIMKQIGIRVFDVGMHVNIKELQKIDSTNSIDVDTPKLNAQLLQEHNNPTMAQRPSIQSVIDERYGKMHVTETIAAKIKSICGANACF